LEGKDVRSPLLALILLLLTVCPCWAEEFVHFADPSLQAAVESTLWITSPTSDDMLTLTSLHAGSGGIVSLTGLEYATNLETLYLDHNRISDLSPLSGLDNLDTLALNTNDVSDLSPLSGLVRLTSLNLHDNEISDISPLSGLEKLEYLVLRINHITDISYLAGLGNLQTLTLEDNAIDDLSALSGLEKLEHLRIGYNQITDLSPLSGLSSLLFLDARGNRISDISPLAALTWIETLVLENNLISDISVLAGLTSLTRLDLRGNPLNQDAFEIYLPQIAADNPGIYLKYDTRASRVLSVSAATGGRIVDPGEGEFFYDIDELVRLEAKADPGFDFIGWSGTFPTARNPAFITLNQDYQMQANFVSVRKVLHVDDNARGDPAAGHPTQSDSSEDGSPEHPFDRIQEAIEVANEGVSILVQPGVYHESIDLLGKNVSLIGMDPNSPAALDWPVIEGTGNGPVVRVAGGQLPQCLLTGFVITAGQGGPGAAILCDGASPTVTHCVIVGNRTMDPNGAAVYCRGSQAALINCTIADNHADWPGAAVMLVDSDVAITNSIVWNNSIVNEILATGTSDPNVQYCSVRGWWPDRGNIHEDPLFACYGRWADPANPDVMLRPENVWAVYIGGDYHLQSLAGRWDPNAGDWVQDEVTSPCVDAGNPINPVVGEPFPNGGIVNMGVYGGTTQASKSPLGQ
jgi:hypothetical protein